MVHFTICLPQPKTLFSKWIRHQAIDDSNFHDEMKSQTDQSTQTDFEDFLSESGHDYIPFPPISGIKEEPTTTVHVNDPNGIDDKP